MHSSTLLPLLSALVLAACTTADRSAQQQTSQIAQPDDTSISDTQLIQQAGAPLLGGLGDYTHPISSKIYGTQRYFDQGMVMASGFNHAEAIRAFKAAQRLDPACAICYWGEAMATGPNINVTSNGKAVMQPAEREAAYAAISKANTLAPNASQREQDYIQAQARRYNGDPSTSRAPLDEAYAQAMADLAAKYPDDDDAQAMYAESLMVTMPWNYWLDSSKPKPDTVKVIEALETVMQRSPEHALSLHLYIHAVEASDSPERAEQAADTLAGLVPGSGHLVHMPSHIYWRIGRYNDASDANVKAAKVDEDYIAQCNAQGFYPALYYPHNIHFLWASASMEGRSQVAIEAGEKVARNVNLDQIKQFPPIEFFHTIPLLSSVRFGDWEKILAAPEPADELQFSKGIWQYARGMASLRTDNLADAELAAGELEQLKNHERIFLLDGNDYPASTILGIASALLAGELDMARGNNELAINAFKQAVELQDALPYTEPPFWYYPTRQTLGHALIQTSQAAEAEAVYRQDLKNYPRNGWSLFGLARSLDMQGKTEEARQVRQRFDKMWANADITIDSSVI